MQTLRDTGGKPHFGGVQLRLRGVLRNAGAEVAIEGTRWCQSRSDRSVSWVAFQVGRAGYRAPDADETGLSAEEILIGIRDGVIR